MGFVFSDDVGADDVVQQVFQFIFMINCMELPENVRTGRLDFLLLQPANSMFLASIRKFDPGAMVNATIGLGFVAYASGEGAWRNLAGWWHWYQLNFFVALVIGLPVELTQSRQAE